MYEQNISLKLPSHCRLEEKKNIQEYLLLHLNKVLI